MVQIKNWNKKTLHQSARNARAHKAGNGASDQCFDAQFSEIFSLIRSKLANSSNLYPDGRKVGKPAQSVSGNKDGFWVLYDMAIFHFPKRNIGHEFI